MTTPELRQLSTLIDAIYEGATDADAWAKALPRIAEWLEAPMALLFTPLTPPPQGGFVVPHQISQATLESWAQSKHVIDLWSHRAMERGLMRDDRIIVDAELATEAELRASAWYQEFLHSRHIARLMTCIVFGSDNTAQLCTALSLFRSWGDSAFDAQAKARFGLLTPHLSRALGLMMTLRGHEIREASTRAALNRLSVGVVLMAADESIGFANQAAEKVFRQADGLTVRDGLGSGKLRLNVWHEASREALRRATRAALDRQLHVAHFNHKVHVSRPSGHTPYAVQLSSCTDIWAAGHVPGTPCAVLLIVDPEQRYHIDPDALCQLHGLTVAEARVAVALLDDDKPEAVAVKLGVQPSTVRSHTARLYEKLGVNSRASLVKLLLSHAEP